MNRDLSGEQFTCSYQEKKEQGCDCSQRRVCHMLGISLNLLDGEVVACVFIEFFLQMSTILFYFVFLFFSA